MRKARQTAMTLMQTRWRNAKEIRFTQGHVRLSCFTPRNNIAGLSLRCRILPIFGVGDM